MDNHFPTIVSTRLRKSQISDEQEFSRLKPFQKAALENVRAANRSRHEEALPRLRERVQRLGFAGHDDIDKALRSIHEQAPIIINVDLARFG